MKFKGHVSRSCNLINNFKEKSESFLLKYQNDEESKKTKTKFDKLNKTLNDGVTEIGKTQKRLDDKYRKCIVLGSVSSGKSTFINSLLKKEILPNDFGTCSNCMIQIQKSSDNTSYMKYKNEKMELEVDQLISWNESSNYEDIIEIYYQRQLEMFNICENLIIYDTPGINYDEENDKIVKKTSDNCDLIILLVDSTKGLSLSDKDIILKFTTQFSKFNVFIVFNFWDMIPKRRKDSLKLKYESDAKLFLVQILKMTNDEAKKRIHFISALKNLEHYETGKEVDQILKDSYNNMINEIQNQLNINFQIINQNQQMDTIQRLQTDMSSIIDELIQNGPIYEKITETSEKPNKMASDSSNFCIESFLKIVKKHKDNLNQITMEAETEKIPYFDEIIPLLNTMDSENFDLSDNENENLVSGQRNLALTDESQKPATTNSASEASNSETSESIDTSNVISVEKIEILKEKLQKKFNPNWEDTFDEISKENDIENSETFRKSNIAEVIDFIFQINSIDNREENSELMLLKYFVSNIKSIKWDSNSNMISKIDFIDEINEKNHKKDFHLILIKHFRNYLYEKYLKDAENSNLSLELKLKRSYDIFIKESLCSLIGFILNTTHIDEDESVLKLDFIKMNLINVYRFLIRRNDLDYTNIINVSKKINKTIKGLKIVSIVTGAALLTIGAILAPFALIIEGAFLIFGAVSSAFAGASVATTIPGAINLNQQFLLVWKNKKRTLLSKIVPNVFSDSCDDFIKTLLQDANDIMIMKRILHEVSTELTELENVMTPLHANFM